MRLMSTVLALGLVFGLVGCRTDPTQSTKVTGEGGKELKLTPPTDTSIAQGKENKIKVSISRTKFDDDVMISFDQLPEGVTVKEEERKILKGKDSGEFTLVAAADAPVKEGQVVKVTAKSGDMSTQSSFKIEVKKGS